MRDDSADQPPLKRGGGIDPIAGERHFGRALPPDGTRQEPCSTITRNEAERHEALCERRAIRCDSDVAHQRQIQSGPDRGTVDRRDDRYLQTLQRPGDALNAGDVGPPFGAITALSKPPVG